MKKKLRLHTETTIDSSHRLVGYDGKCSELHGHTWLLRIWIEGESKYKDSVGILFDFGKVKEIKEIFDHKLLNSIPPFDKINPTAENISVFLYEFLKDSSPNLDFCIRLYETAIGKTTYCEYGDFYAN